MIKEKIQFIVMGIVVVTVTSFVTVFSLKSGFFEEGNLFSSNKTKSSQQEFLGAKTVTAVSDSSLDTDGDGLSNADELEVYGTDPWSMDTDGDRISDGDEVLIYKTDPLNKDTDGDGYYDGVEISSGYDPLNPDPSALLETEEGKIKSSIFSEIIAAAENGEEFDLAELGDAEITEDSIRDLGITLGADPDSIKNFKLPEISDSEIKIGEDSSSAAISKYFNSLQEKLYTNCTFCSLEGGNEMMNLLQSGDLSSLASYATDFDKMSTELLDIEVAPVQDLIGLHKQGVGFGAVASQVVGDIGNFGLTYDGALNSLIELRGLITSFQGILSSVDSVSTMYNLGIPSTNLSISNSASSYGLDLNNLTEE